MLIGRTAIIMEVGKLNEKILVVEDNPQNMRLIEMTLRTGGYIFFKAMDGEEALDVAVKEKPDLIIMDIQIPKMTGDEVTRKLRQMPEFQSTTIIALTAYAMKGDEEKFIKAGCDTYISKPINTREFPRLIADLLQNRKQGAPGTIGG